MTRIRLWSLVLLVAILSVSGGGCDFSQTPNSLKNLPPVEVYFSPRGGCTEAVVGEIESAKSTILVQAYSFTSAPIAQALVGAHQRGVEVAVILDKSQESEKYSSADFVLHAGIPTRIDAHHAIAHNKIMILDGRTVITGSFNFTKAAEESNAENLLVIRDPAMAELYTQNWRLHAEHSQAYLGKKAAETNDRPASSKKSKSNSHR
jgi:phosphatidylserine/phosphatidylglycerophosphate/cardiolipin synthase-like enzyme